MNPASARPPLLALYVPNRRYVHIYDQTTGAIRYGKRVGRRGRHVRFAWNLDDRFSLVRSKGKGGGLRLNEGFGRINNRRVAILAGRR